MVNLSRIWFVDPDRTDDGTPMEETDAVCLVNAGPGSYCATFPDPDERVRVDTRNATVWMRPAASPARFEAILETIVSHTGRVQDELRKMRRKDDYLRSIFHDVEEHLLKGGLIYIEKMGEGNDLLACNHEYHPTTAPSSSAITYYAVLAHPAHKCRFDVYCLGCFEDLWGGNQFIGPLPTVNWHRQTPREGTYEDSLHKDGRRTEMHTSHTDTQARQAPMNTLPQAQHGSRKPLNRFQHAAKFIEAGTTLAWQEQATVELWVLATQEQRRWQEYSEQINQAPTLYLHQDANTCRFVRPGVGPPTNLREDERAKSIEDLLGRTGMTKDQCYARVLSTVLEAVTDEISREDDTQIFTEERESYA